MTLTNKKVKDTYVGVLNVNSVNNPLTSTLQSVKDGLGNASALKIATDKVGISDYVFPLEDGTAGQVMVTDGSGNISWVDNSSTVNFNSFVGDIIPAVDNTYSLGSETRAWRDIYVGPGSFYIDGQEIVKSSSATIFLQADPNQNIAIRARGTGDIEFSTDIGGSIQFKDVVLFDDLAAIKAGGVAGVVFGDHINMEYQMTKYRIRNLATPVSGNDAANKDYVDANTVNYTPVNKAGDTMTGILNMGGNKITGLGTPTTNTDAATKLYVDNALAGLSWKTAVRVATTGAITLANTPMVDGVMVANGDRVLVKNQGDATQHGIYEVISSGVWVRASDADNNPGAEIGGGTAVFVKEGTTNADTGWTVTSPQGTASLGVDGIVWTQFAGGPSLTAGDGLQQTGNAFEVNSTVVRTTGNQTLAGTKTFSSTITGSITGNAGTATALQTGRTIAITGGATGTATLFDGTGNISIPVTSIDASALSGVINTARLPSDVVKTSGNQTIDGVKTFNSTITGSITGNAGTATALQTSRNISITGAVTGTATAFNGSADIAINTTGVNASNINSGTIPTARLPLDVVKTSGDQSIDGIKTFTSTISGSINGNAATATVLQTGRTIAIGGGASAAPVSFNGSSNITLTISDLNATNLTSGTVATARLGSNVMLTDLVQTVSARKVFEAGQAASTSMLTATGGLGGLELRTLGAATSAGAAFIAFHRPSSYATYLGLDTDNQITIGGWSAGAAMGNMKVGSLGVGQAASGTAGSIRATSTVEGLAFNIGGDATNQFNAGQLYLRNTAPIIFMRDSDGLSSAVHVQGNQFLIGRTSVNDSTSITAWPLIVNLNTGNLSIEGSTTAASFTISSDTNNRFQSGSLVLRGASPTVYFRDTDHKSGMIHVNADIMYFLGGAIDSETWTQVNGQWPLYLNLTDNNATFGGDIYQPAGFINHSTAIFTTNTTITKTVNYWSGAAVTTVTLPTAVGGRMVMLKNAGTVNTTINANTGDLIEGAASIVMIPGEAKTLVAIDATTWLNMSNETAIYG